jgi:ABC-type nitrate/sulfonate/bicarbonate transport system permease component
MTNLSETDLNIIRKRERDKLKKEKLRTLLLGILGFVLFISAWYGIVYLQIIDRKLIVYPHEVFQTLIYKLSNKVPDGALLLQHVGSSLVVALSGFLMAVGIGVPLGLLMGWYKQFDRFMRPLFEVIRPIPPISWIPITIILLGIGLEAKMVIIFFSAFIPSLINSYTGIQSTAQVYRNVAITCGATKWTSFLRVGIPSALPMVFAGMRISLGNAWSTLVAAEMLAASKGLGFMILMGRTYQRVDLIIGGMLVIGAIGILFSAGFDKIEKAVIKWRR